MATELDDILGMCITDPFGIDKEVDKYIDMLEQDRKCALDEAGINSASEYLNNAGVHTLSVRRCIAINAILERTTAPAKRSAGGSMLLQRAIDHLKKASDEQKQAANFDLGVIAFEKNKLNASAKLFEKAAEAKPEETNPQVHYNWGVVRHTLRDYWGAPTQYQIALSDRPRYYAALNNLAVTSIRTEQFATAKRQFAEALRAKPDGYEALHNLVQLCITLDESKEAIKYLEQINMSDKKEKKIAGMLAKEYFKIGDYEKAKECGAIFVKSL